MVEQLLLIFIIGLIGPFPADVSSNRLVDVAT